MIIKPELEKQIPFTLDETNFPKLGERYKGKVRDVYANGNQLILIATDRVSAFDRILTTIPFKGQVLNQMAAFWFEKLKKIIPNHVIAIPDPNVIVARKVEIIPIEIVIRGHLTGSAWRDYDAGKSISGLHITPGMRKDQKFEEPLLTPSTKAKHGHDLPISTEQIIEQGIISRSLMETIEKTAKALYKKGNEICAKHNLILVDTKYEFGLLDGALVLADEVHTPDSSRFWYKDTYQELFEAGKDQRMIDKEYFRQWLIREKGFMGDGPIPEIPDEIRVEFARRYIEVFEQITGETFSGTPGPVLERIKENMKSKGYL
ncbi:phosphoribosylaminoimidazolesuccinocarboxamide synthase [Candidatus Woesearchaeota archaeon]|nr:phosphoribosylaminoimidazolesuccinocarboxamide synthase [Candidatus Woesearchaeota archaeon]